MSNWHVEVREWQDEIIFLRKVLPGPADKSYGIQVARLAGLPESIINRAKAILTHLELSSAKRDAHNTQQHQSQASAQDTATARKRSPRALPQAREADGILQMDMFDMLDDF